MGKKKKADTARVGEADTVSFEEAMERLEAVVGQLEDGRLGLNASLDQYELGVKYLRRCYRELERAERKIELLSGIGESGEVVAEPFGEADMSLEQKQSARSRRRSRPASDPEASGPAMDDPSSLF